MSPKGIPHHIIGALIISSGPNYSTTNAMVSVWSASTSAAATEQGTQSLLQSTAAVNIIFVNMDWKKSRHATEESTAQY